MKVTYIAKRHRDGKFYCYDVIADGSYLSLFLSEGAPVEKIALYVEDRLNNPFPEHRMNDSISVIMESNLLDIPRVLVAGRWVPRPDMEASKTDNSKGGAIPVFPEGKPSMQWKSVEMQNYLAAFGIEYSDGDKKAEMLDRISEHFSG